MKKPKKLIPFLVILAILGTSVSAILLSGWIVRGSFQATKGSTPDAIEETWNINIVDNNNVTNAFSYDNTNGEQEVNISLTDNIESNTVGCFYQPDLDIQFYINNGFYRECHLTTTNPCVKMLTEGINDFSIIVVPHPNRCELIGNYSIGFTV